MAGPGNHVLKEGTIKRIQLSVFVDEGTCFSGYSNRQTQAYQYTG